MDKVLYAIAAVGCAGICAAVAAWVISNHRQRTLLREAGEWPTAEATVESGALEKTRDSGRGALPVFAFSYEVLEERYSGRFALLPNLLLPDPRSAQAMLDRLIGRRLLLHYNPGHPEQWLLSDEVIEGWKVEQKIGSHVVRDLSPGA